MYAIRSYYEEIKTLARMRHPNIVRIRHFFLANNTAYLVMDYERGTNLGAYIKERKGGLSATFIRITSYNVCYTKLLRDCSHFWDCRRL